MITVQGRFRNGALRLANRALAATLPAAKAPVRPAKPRVLVIRCDYLGDATLATAPLQTIRDTLQPSQMDVLCAPWAAEIFKGHPAVDEILSVAAPWWLLKQRVGLPARVSAWIRLISCIRLLRGRQYDIGIDLRGDLRQFVAFFVLGGIPERISSDRTGGAVLLTACATHRDDVSEVDHMLEIAALVGAPRRGRPVIARRSLSAERRLSLRLPERFIAVAPRGASPNRQWPSERVGELAQLLTTSLDLPLVYVGSAADQPHAISVERMVTGRFVNLAGATTVPEMIGVLEEAELVVAVDSGPMHIAAALGKPLVALWGPGSRDMRPYSDDAVIVEPPVPCECTGPKCRFTAGAGRCYRSMTGEQVYLAVQEQLATLDASIGSPTEAGRATKR